MHRSPSFVVLLIVAVTPGASADHLPNTLNFANVTSGAGIKRPVVSIGSGCEPDACTCICWHGIILLNAKNFQILLTPICGFNSLVN